MPLGRMYRPKGEAFETAQVVLGELDPYALNVAMGCSNGCPTCYGRLAFKRPLWNVVSHPSPFNIEQIGKDILKHKPKGVFMSFATDPLLDENLKDTNYVVNALVSNKIKTAILSKIVPPKKKLKFTVFSKDFDYHDLIYYGKTIVSFDKEYYQVNEPNATSPYRRFMELSESKYHRWISCEPYPCPAVHKQNTRKFLEQLIRCDPELIVFGKLNYDKRSSTKEAREFYHETWFTFADFCQDHAIKIHVKWDTQFFTGGDKRENGQDKAIDGRIST